MSLAVSREKRNLQVLVFRTNLQITSSVEKVRQKLVTVNGIYRSTVDLEDWEKVLRIECSPSVSRHEVSSLLNTIGYECIELE
jgi:hypothetical protein